MSNLKQAIPFFGVNDMERSIQFYTELLGFKMTLSWRPEGKLRWANLNREGIDVMIQQQHNIPVDNRGAGVSICFICEDALALYSEFSDKGLSLPEPFVGNNMWVVELKDPDGYMLCFESATDVEEGTTYAQWKNR